MYKHFSPPFLQFSSDFHLSICFKMACRTVVQLTPHVLQQSVKMTSIKNANTITLIITYDKCSTSLSIFLGKLKAFFSERLRSVFDQDNIRQHIKLFAPNAIRLQSPFSHGVCLFSLICLMGR